MIELICGIDLLILAFLIIYLMTGKDHNKAICLTIDYI